MYLQLYNFWTLQLPQANKHADLLYPPVLVFLFFYLAGTVCTYLSTITLIYFGIATLLTQTITTIPQISILNISSCVRKLSLKLILAHLQKKWQLEHVLRNVIGISLQQDPTHFKHIFKYHTTMTSFASQSTDITPPQCVSTFTCLFITMSFHFK